MKKNEKVRKYLYAAFAAALLVLPVAVTAQAQTAAPDAGKGYLMTESEKENIRNIVKEFIRDNPGFIMDTLEKEAQKQANKEAAENSKIENPPESLYNSKESPFVGNPNGKVTIVEFFDYNCGYCKRVVGDVQRLINENKDVKVVFKELPILSDESQIAARYALAAREQGKYFEFHVALMKHSGQLSEKEILRLADTLQIDIKKLNADVYNTKIGDQLTENVNLAKELGIRGTPFFVVGKEKVPGAVGFERLNAMAKAAALASPEAAPAAAVLPKE